MKSRGSRLAGLPGWAEGMLEDARVARLGLLGADDRPRVLPVTFALFRGHLYSAIDRKPKRGREPARIRYLHRRPDAALTVDHYEDDWSALAWVQVLGRIELLRPDQDEAAFAALCAKYPQYRDDPPPGPLLCLEPDRVLYWRASG
jgi:PPOX class probable F420-dependent enzyme